MQNLLRLTYRWRSRFIAVAMLMALWVVVAAQAPAPVTGVFVAAPPAITFNGCIGPCHASYSFTMAEMNVGTLEISGANCGAGGYSSVGTANGIDIWDRNATTGPEGCGKITAAVNYPGGAGGAGFRHCRTDAGPEHCISQGLKMELTNGGLSQFSMSWRMRWTLGFPWSGNNPSFTKDIWIDGTNIVGFQGGGFGFNRGGGLNLPACTVITAKPPCTPSLTWNAYNGGSNVGDGIYHCHEIRWDFPNQTAELWFDGVKKQALTAVGWAGGQTLTEFFFSNQLDPDDNVTALYSTDYDDFLIDGGTAADYQIGCVGM